jgi:hypothetical protein
MNSGKKNRAENFGAKVNQLYLPFFQKMLLHKRRTENREEQYGGAGIAHILRQRDESVCRSVEWQSGV